MKMFVCAFVALAAFGCKTQAPQPLCNIMFATVTGAAQEVGAALECANVPAIAADLSASLQKLTLCEASQQGAVADMVCPVVVDFVTSASITALPAKWECKGGKLTEQATVALTAACKKIKY